MTSFINKLFPANLADVIVVIAESDLNETTKRDLISAINRTANILGLNPADITTNVRHLRGQLGIVHPKQAGISAKSWSNIKANITRALVITRVIPDMKAYPLAPSWDDVLGTATVRHHVYGLSRLARFCSKKGIEPSDLSDEVVQRFHDHLETSLLTNQPKAVAKATVDIWNRVSRESDLDLPLLTPIREQRYRARKLTAYSPLLQEEIAEYLDRLAVNDLFAEEGPTKALRPTSIRNVEAHLRQYLDALATAGYPPTFISCLHDALLPQQVRAACSVIVNRNNGNVPSGLPNIMATVIAVSRFYVKAPEERMRELLRIRAQIEAHRGNQAVTLGSKSVERLQQFEDPHNLAEILSLPERLMTWARTKPDRRYAGLEAMHAVAISILLTFPVRIQNLTSIDIEKHLSSRMEGKKRLYSLRIEGTEVKNSMPLEVDFGEETSALIQTYLRDFRHKVSYESGTALFPKKNGGGPRAASCFGAELSQRIKRETGLDMHVHLFRHLAAKLFLDQHPGEYETIRRLLGHKKLETTMSFYARLTNKAAAKRYDEVVLEPLRGRKRD